MSLVATLKALAAAGGTAEQLIAVVEAHEAAKADALSQRRAADAVRQKRYRNNVMSRDDNVTERDSRDTSPHVRERSAQVVFTSSSSLRSEEVGGVGGETREAFANDWPEGKPTDLTRKLVEAVGSPWLDPSKSHGLVTTAGRLAAWKRDGASWERDVVPVVTALCGKQRGPVSTWKFFDQAIGRSVADNRAALEIPPAGQVVPFRSQGPPSFADQLAAEKAEARRRVLEDGQ